MNTRDTPPAGYNKKVCKKNGDNKNNVNEIQSSPGNVNGNNLYRGKERQNNPPQINERPTQSYRENAPAGDSVHNHGGGNHHKGSSEEHQPDNGLSAVQQQFVLRFCRQLASVIAACEQSESAEIEIGRRRIDSSPVKVKLQAEREYSDETR